jgi:uncharacterized membrane protein
VGVSVLAYAVYFAVYTCLAHLTFMTMAYDLGTVDQGVWLAGHSRDLFVTVRGLPLLGDHVRPIAFVLAPLYWVWDDVRILLIAQTLFIAAGAVFLWLIGKLALPERPAWVAALCVGYLLNPFVQNLNLDHVHPDAFASTFILASLYFLRTSRYGPFWTSAALAMACKEDIPLVYAALGITLLIGPQRRTGIVLTAVASAYFALCLGWILPHFNGVGFFRGRFFLGHARQKGVFSLLSRLMSPDSARYVFILGLPLGFCFLLAPVTLAPAFPALLSNLVNEVWYARSPIYHYATSIVPFLYVGAFDALARNAKHRSLHAPARALRCSWLYRLIPVALLGCAVLANIEYSKVPITDVTRISDLWRIRNAPANAEIHAVLGRIPRDAAVSADYTLVPQLSHRQRIYLFPNPFIPEQWGVHAENPHDPSTIDYIVVRPGVAANKQKQVLGPLLKNGTFTRQGNEKSVNVYVRVKK